MPERAAGASLLCLVLMGCGSGKTALGTAPAIECAIGPHAVLRSDCPVERDADILTIRHADGGFRRLRIVRDGRGLISADGAEDAKVSVAAQGKIELAIGNERYRLPAAMAEAGQ